MTQAHTRISPDAEYYDSAYSEPPSAPYDHGH
jgi:hypothetical protein